MPIYDYRCACGHHEENVYSKMDEYPHCPKCDTKLERVIGRTYAIQDSMAPYFNHDTQEWIDSKSRHRKFLKRQGKIDVGGETVDSLRKHIRKPDPYRKDDVKRDIAEVFKGYGH